MTEYDPTWKNPSEAQNAALEHALKYAEPFLSRLQRQSEKAEEFYPPITEFDIAEMMCIADSSLWYSQAKSWAEGKGFPAQGADNVFQLAGSAIKRLVESGYSNNKWWDATQVWDNPQVIALSLVSIVEVVRLLREIRLHSLNINSQWFEALPYLMIPGLKVEEAIKNLGKGESGAGFVTAAILAHYDPEFAKKLRAIQDEINERLHDAYIPTKCIHPKCENLVSPVGIQPREGHFKNYRGTGACQRGHNAYLCSKCNAPHNYATKIGKAHYEQYYVEDFTNH